MSNVINFISNLDNESKISDSIKLLSILEDFSGYKPYLTGSIIGFGSYHYKYESGREGDSSIIAFSPRKKSLVIYIMTGFSKFESLLKELGKYKLGKCCLYINKLSDIDLDVLKKIISLSIEEMKMKYECKDVIE